MKFQYFSSLDHPSIHRSINVGTLLIINCTPSLKGHNFLTQSIIIDQVLAHFEFIEIKAFLSYYLFRLGPFGTTL